VTSSPTVRRGIAVEVETVEAAEFDLVHYGLDDSFVAKAAHSITALPLASDDLADGAFRLRRIEGFDVVFLLARDDARVVATIFRIWPARESDRLRKVLQGIDLLAMLRGATGV